MNAASQNLPQHLETLRLRMLHPSDYELAVTYFLEEFAGDVGFLRQSEPDAALPLLTVVRMVASRAMSRPVTFAESKVFRLSAHGFFHGSAITETRVILFFYFEDVDTGIAAFIPDGRGAMEVARFRLASGLIDPTRN